VGFHLGHDVRDHPTEASWMSKDCCDQLAGELALEQTTLPHMANFRATLLVPGVILLCLQYFCWSAGIYGFVLWLPTMIRLDRRAASRWLACSTQFLFC